ncbi:sensor domain-containing diguanylate cyclase [Bordetella genomosp. 13]|uniref:GGDEF domain-containing protein n=1 Tax=Bordetella genomosp. 13 TaxID=463040 RepID=A0A1W6ZIV2_9BORD|nr:sensor domain-containing diguanylate cyclase [Bordetella genomosp. 13]ARP97348.1 GGDEF domain-containing protein [Bordetella genomosp. 13]
MQPAPIPSNEEARIAALRTLNILDTLPEERFDRYTRMARRLFGVPVSLVSLIDTDRQWFKSRMGLDVPQTPRDVSFCGHAILGDGVLLVPDARNDERFHDNPLVSGDPHIRFYAGCPLAAPDGSKLGTLCLLDFEPRSMDEENQGLLRDLAGMVQEELSSVHLAGTDPLTGLSNRLGFETLAQHALSFCQRMGKSATLLYFDLNDFKPINDQFGHAEGDRALVTFAAVLRSSLRNMDIIARLGGDEFVVLLVDALDSEVDGIVRRMRNALDERNHAMQRGYELRYSVGRAAYDAQRHATVQSLLADADASMYEQKRVGKAAR